MVRGRSKRELESDLLWGGDGPVTAYGLLHRLIYFDFDTDEEADRLILLTLDALDVDEDELIVEGTG